MIVSLSLVSFYSLYILINYDRAFLIEKHAEEKILKVCPPGGNIIFDSTFDFNKFRVFLYGHMHQLILKSDNYIIVWLTHFNKLSCGKN